MGLLLLATGFFISVALMCQIGHYVVKLKRPWWHAIFPPKLREWIFPVCPLCWPARGMVAACVVAMFLPS